MTLDVELEKTVVARHVLKLVEGIELLGLGSGTTVAKFVEVLSSSQLARKIKVIPSSSQIEAIARKNNLEIVDPSYGRPEITIDGADEIDSDLNLLKGGGGALVREKILATSSDCYVIIADHTKVVERLCTRKPLPIEVLPYGLEWTLRMLEQSLNVEVRLREINGDLFISDNGNYIIDAYCKLIEDPEGLEKQIKLYPGVVDVGIFTNLADEVYVAYGEEVRVFSI